MIDAILRPDGGLRHVWETTTKFDIPTPQQTESNPPASTKESIANMTTASNESSPSQEADLTTAQPTTQAVSSTAMPSYLAVCPSLVNCTNLSVECLDCQLNSSCVYGREYNVTCSPKPDLNCTGDQVFMKRFRCRYCYQSDASEHTCTHNTNCRVNSNPPTMVRVNCSINDDVLCLGQRKFYRRNRCNWTSGYRWTTALTFSITLGGFGADRFYLGYWRQGLGKLFSFGGLGVWTLVDVVLIAVGYVGPEDGSYYI
ncbi:TM2 domain-containing protein 3-like isoform X2 [Acanthaster planci]|uniref:TM2 domain-containing protein 3-like isoform X2 n=1 Tax=Acanthaster planci TaxID=133434 RepID=A0A8B7ZSW0_ACAPL|nr:TM2 domain-containing protein 3-like isoform X2 [Acanthaster planci]